MVKSASIFGGSSRSAAPKMRMMKMAAAPVFNSRNSSDGSFGAQEDLCDDAMPMDCMLSAAPRMESEELNSQILSQLKNDKSSALLDMFKDESNMLAQRSGSLQDECLSDNNSINSLEEQKPVNN